MAPKPTQPKKSPILRLRGPGPSPRRKLTIRLPCTKNPRGPCKFLEIPPEMRNAIYDLVFATDPDEVAERLVTDETSQTDTPPDQNSQIDLLKDKTALRSRALLQTCRQIAGEAKGAYEQYWKQGEFVFNIASIFDIPAAIDVMKQNEEGLQVVTHLSVALQSGRQLWVQCAPKQTFFHLQYKNVWKVAQWGTLPSMRTSPRPTGWSPPMEAVVARKTLKAGAPSEFGALPLCSLGVA